MAAVSGSSSRTISFWAKLASTGTTARAAFSYGSSGTQTSSMVTMPGSTSKLYDVTDGTNTTASGSSIDTAWHFVAMTYSGGATTVYLDGASATTSTSVAFINTGSNVLNIGNDFNAVKSKFAGYLLDFRVYDYELTSSAVSTMYTNGPNDGKLTVTSAVTAETTTRGNGAITLTVTNYSVSYSVTWADSASTSVSRTGLAAGAYTATVTSSLGYSVSMTIYVSASHSFGYIARYRFNSSSLTTDDIGSYSLVSSGSPATFSDSTYGTVFDSVGSYALTASGSPTISTDATYGTVLSLNGSSYLFASSAMTAVTGSAPRTISFWSKISDLATQRVAFSYGSDETSAAVRVQVPTSSTVAFRIADGSTGTFNSATTPSTSWRMYTVTYSGGSAGTTIGYLNGASNISTTSTVVLSGTTTTNPLNIGRTFSDNLAKYLGLMTDFRVYSYQLTSTAVTALYAN
ncbi:unnamed protein product, partial [Phaeothamnion confervicola]